MATPEQLMREDFEARYVGVEVSESFARIYPGTDAINRMFAYFHERLNAHFEFMNYKARGNGHFNADDSRSLLALMEEISDVRQLLRRIGVEFEVAEYYAKCLELSRGFLRESGGSPIPDGFEPIELVRYEPVFLLPDTRIVLEERYEALELHMVGSGSFANVYRFTDPVYGVPMALKRAKRDLDERDLVRFKNEFDLLKSLRFPYVLDVFRYDEARHEYTMEYCESTLRAYIDRHNQTMTFTTRKRIALQFLYGMNFLHRAGHLHRDVSYQNVLVKEYDGGAVLVKLSDFGLMKERDSELTRTESELRGTILDPTITSFREYNLANEIYAIGFVLSFIFTGRLAIDATTGEVRAVIDRCVAYDVASRPADVMSIIREVETLDAGPDGEQETPA